jgi:hypothetical protein
VQGQKTVFGNDGDKRRAQRYDQMRAYARFLQAGFALKADHKPDSAARKIRTGIPKKVSQAYFR